MYLDHDLDNPELAALQADYAALRSVARRLLEGDVPALAQDGHSYWCGLDETCVPTYQGDRLTDEEVRILLEIS